MYYYSTYYNTQTYISYNTYLRELFTKIRKQNGSRGAANMMISLINLPMLRNRYHRGHPAYHAG
jgi:hypothetical protein